MLCCILYINIPLSVCFIFCFIHNVQYMCNFIQMAILFLWVISFGYIQRNGNPLPKGPEQQKIRKKKRKEKKSDYFIMPLKCVAKLLSKEL